MGCKPDSWAKEWIERERAENPEKVRGWTIEKHGSVHYIKWGTTVWDPDAKKYRKKTKHIGKLNPNGTVTFARERQTDGSEGFPEPLGMKDYGNAIVLEKSSDHIIGPLKECFPEIWKELLALAEIRLLGDPRLSHAGDIWRLLDDTRGLDPRMSADSLSDVLDRAGRDSAAQERLFEELDDGNGHVAVDLSVIFSRSKGIRMLRKGYNRFKLGCKQFNLAAVCSLENGKPTMLSMVCGNVKEDSVKGMMKRFAFPKHSVLVMDRGYGGKDIADTVTAEGHDFIVALRRNSKAYDSIDTEEGHFTWEGRVIDYGRGTFWGYHAYRFEDLRLRADELHDIYKAEEGGKRMGPDNDRAGNIMLLSSLNIDPYQVYRMYKMRCSVENFFDTAKNDLSGDCTYLGTDAKVMGYNLVTFLAYCIWWDIRSRLESADLFGRLTPDDVLRKFAAVKVYHTAKGPVVSDIPKDVREISEAIGIGLARWAESGAE